MKHRAEPVPGTRIGMHARCQWCPRIVFLASPSRSRVDSHVVAAGGWRHVSDSTSSMIPEKLRFRAENT